MAVSAKKMRGLARVLNYTTPTLHKGKSWYIDYLAYDPVSNSLKRKKHMLNGIGSIRERNARAAEMVATLSAKLRSGWTPWMDGLSIREYTKTEDIFANYFRSIERRMKSGDLKEKSYKDLEFRVRTIMAYNEMRPQPAYYAYQLDTAFFSDYLDYYYIDREVNARTRNNYRNCASTFCSWMKEKGYIKENPVEPIRKLKEEEKIRSAITPEDMGKIREYLSVAEPDFLLLCSFAYYTLIRPDEISHIRLQDMNLKAQTVRISAEIAKNRREQVVSLPDTLIKMMVERGVFRADGACYLFGRGFRPSLKKLAADNYRKHFKAVMKDLRMPACYQFYSLKDTGIRDLANAKGVVVARDQARHSDIHTTNKYLKYEGVAPEEAKHFKGLL